MYYFNLEAVFTQCAEFVAAVKTYELLGPNAVENDSDTNNTATEELGSSSVVARMTAPSSSHVKPASKKNLQDTLICIIQKTINSIDSSQW